MKQIVGPHNFQSAQYFFSIYTIQVNKIVLRPCRHAMGKGDVIILNKPKAETLYLYTIKLHVSYVVDLSDRMGVYMYIPGIL